MARFWRGMLGKMTRNTTPSVQQTLRLLGVAHVSNINCTNNNKITFKMNEYDKSKSKIYTILCLIICIYIITYTIQYFSIILYNKINSYRYNLYKMMHCLLIVSCYTCVWQIPRFMSLLPLCYAFSSVVWSVFGYWLLHPGVWEVWSILCHTLKHFQYQFEAPSNTRRCTG